MEHVVREPTVDDAEALGRVHVRAWQVAYRGGLMPDDYLDGLDERARADMWREGMARRSQDRSRRLVVETATGEVAGFALVGPAGGDPHATVGELYALNVEPDAWGSGLGSALITSAHAALAEFGFSEAILWVHPDNTRARRFYEHHGWVDDGVERTEDVLGVEVPEARYSIDLGRAAS